MPRLRDYMPSVSGVRSSLTPKLILDQREADKLGMSRRQLNLARAWHLELLPSLAILEGGLVIDIGAHVGLWTSDLLGVAPTATVVAVEPQDALRAELEKRFAGDGRVTIESRALADSEGTREFHMLGSSVNGSLRSPQPDMDALYRKGWELKETVTVETTTVDALTAGRPVALLKIDVQGAEGDVLAGATETLSRTAAVMLEVTFISHYEGDATFPVLHELMTDAGFRLTGISEPARSPRGAMLCADACYVHVRHLDDYFSRSAA